MKRVFIFIYLIATVFISFSRLYQLHFLVNILVLYLLFLFTQQFSKIYFPFVLLIIPFFLGLIGIFGNNFKDVFRDIFYFQLPLTYSLIGYQISKTLDKKTILKYFIKAGVLYTIIYLIFTLKIFLFSDRYDFYYIRDEVGPGNTIVVILIVLMFFHNKYSELFQIHHFIQKAIIFFALITFILFASRLYLIMLIVFILLIGVNSFSVKSIVFLFFFIFILSLSFLLFSKYEFGELSFVAKLMRSVSELSVKDYNNPDEMTNNLRSFEVYTALNDIFNNTSLKQFLFGKGFGVSLELPVTLNILEIEWDSLPVIHNGYFFANLKVGIVGLLSTLFFYFFIFKHFKLLSLRLNFRSSQTPYFISKIGIASVLCILISNVVINGFYNPETGLLQIFTMSLFSNSELS